MEKDYLTKEQNLLSSLKEARRLLINSIDLAYRENSSFLSETQVEENSYRYWYENTIKPIEQDLVNLNTRIEELEIDIATAEQTNYKN